MDNDSTSSDESTGESFSRQFQEAFPNLMVASKMKRAQADRPFHDLGKKQRFLIRKQIKLVMQDYDRLLKTMGLCIGGVEVAAIENAEDSEAAANNHFKFTINEQGTEGAILDPSAEAQLDPCLYVKDKHSLADKTYGALRSLCHIKVPTIGKIKQRRKELDEMLKVHENEMGVFYSMRDKLVSRLEAFFDQKYGVSQTIDDEAFNDDIIHVKLSADGINFFI